MSDFDDRFSDQAAPALLTQFGRTVAYTLAGAVTDNITALVGDEMDAEERGPDGRRGRRRRDVTICTQNIGFGYIAAPSLAATVNIANVEYAVARIEAAGPVMARLVCERIGTVEKSRPEYRRQ